MPNCGLNQRTQQLNESPGNTYIMSKDTSAVVLAAGEWTNTQVRYDRGEATSEEVEIAKEKWVRETLNEGEEEIYE